MEHAPQNRKPQQSQQYSYTPEVEQDTSQSQPSAHEPKADHSVQPESRGVYPSEKKKEAIVPNLLQPESPHKNLPYAWNQPESPHKNLPPELKRSNPNPNADRPKEPSRFSFEKSAQKDTDPNAPKLPNKPKEPSRFSFEKSAQKDTDPNASKLPDKPKEPSRFSLENRSKTTTPPSSNVVKTVPNQTPEQVVRKDDPIVPQQVLNPAIREPQALNTPAKAPDIKPDQEPSMQQATPIPTQRSPYEALQFPLENAPADRKSNSSPAALPANQSPIAAVQPIDEKNTRPAKPDLTQQPSSSQSYGNTLIETSKSQSGMSKSAELLAANTRFRPPNGPDRVCFDLLEIIEQLAKELKNRFDDMLSDQHGLYIAMKTQQEYKLPKSVGTWGGHITKYENVQKELKKKLKESKDHCDDDDPYGYGFSESYALAEEYVSKAPPEHPSNVSLDTAPNWVTEIIQNLGGQIVDGVIIIGKGIGEAAVFLLILFAKILSAPFERQV